MMDQDYEFEEDARYFSAQKGIMKAVSASQRGLTISQLVNKVGVAFLSDAITTLEGQSMIVNTGSVLRPVYKLGHRATAGPTKVCFFCSISRPATEFKVKGKIEKVCATCRKFKTKPKKSKKR